MIRYWLTVHWPHPKSAKFDEGWHVFLKPEYQSLAKQVKPNDRVLFFETVKGKPILHEGGDGTIETISRWNGRGGIVCSAEVIDNHWEKRKDENGDVDFPIKIACGNYAICKIVNGKPTKVKLPTIIGNIDPDLRFLPRIDFAEVIGQPTVGFFTFKGGLLAISHDEFLKLFDLLTK